MILPHTQQVRSEMRELLERWLVERDEVLGAPVEHEMASAISWRQTRPS